MSTDAVDLLSRILQLPERDRAEMASRLIRSFEPGAVDADSDAAWLDETNRRLEAVERGEFEASDWREAVARIRASAQ